MRLKTAMFVNNEVEPGWPILREEVPAGKRYLVDLDQVEELTMVNRTTGQRVRLDCIYVVDPSPPGWLPLLALQIEDGWPQA